MGWGRTDQETLNSVHLPPSVDLGMELQHDPQYFGTPRWPFGQSLAPSVFSKLPLDPTKRFASLGQIALQPLVVDVSSNSTPRELVTVAVHFKHDWNK